MNPIRKTTLKIEPQTHVRSTKGDSWLFAVSDEYLEQYDDKRLLDHGKKGGNLRRKRQLEKYNAYKQELRWIASKDGFKLPDGAFAVFFYIPMPKSWRWKKRLEMNGKPHQSKPDCDNLLKSMIDGLIPPKNKTKGEKGRDDKEVWCYAAFKFWVEEFDGRIEIIEYNEYEFVEVFK